MNINCTQIISICNKFLKLQDERLVVHGERVAYIAYKILNHSKYRNQIELKNLLLLSLFHDIGAYKTEEIDRIVAFETVDVERHAVYGYLFAKHFTTLAPLAEAILYHHMPHSKLQNVDNTIRIYAELIHLADRVDIGLFSGMQVENLLSRLKTSDFDSNCLDALEIAFKVGELPMCIGEEQLIAWEQEIITLIDISQTEALDFLNMMVHTIDFISASTVLHSTSIVIISEYIGKKMLLSECKLQSLGHAALIHDIGKAGVPLDILESHGKLDFEQMEIMKKHVSYTHEIIKDILPEDIVAIAVRHHEKLDGSGYPYGLTAADLSVSDRILAVADIVSALSITRSYKDAYRWDKVMNILNDMAEKNLIDSDIVRVVCENHMELQNIIEIESKSTIKAYEDIQEQYHNMVATMVDEKS